MFQAGKQLLDNQPAILMLDKEQKRAFVMDVAIPEEAA